MNAFRKPSPDEVTTGWKLPVGTDDNGLRRLAHHRRSKQRNCSTAGNKKGLMTLWERISNSAR